MPRATRTLCCLFFSSIFPSLGDPPENNQVKKQEIRAMLTDVGKEGTATISLNDFVEMVTPKVLARDPKVTVGPLAHQLKIISKYLARGCPGVFTHVQVHEL